MKAMIQAGVPQTKIASLFGLHQSTISKINRAERWKHLAEQ
jgi:predicted XRE-type DNA-binding protein